MKSKDLSNLFKNKINVLIKRIKEDNNLFGIKREVLLNIIYVLKDVVPVFIDNKNDISIGEGNVWKYQGVKYGYAEHILVFAENDVSDGKDIRDFIFTIESYYGHVDITTELREVCVNYEDFGDCLDNLDFWIHLRSIYQEMKSLMRLIEE